MITEVVVAIVGAAGLLAAGWGLSLLWQKDQSAYDPIPISRRDERVWELPTPFEAGGTYVLRHSEDLATKAGPDDVAPIGVNNTELDFSWPPPPEISATVTNWAVKLHHNQWRCQ